MREPQVSIAALILRVSGLTLACWHGWGKVTRLAAGEGGGFVQGVAELGFPAPELFAWAAALSELVGGMLVFLGFGTRIAAAFAACVVATAAFLRHRLLSQVLASVGLLEVPEETLRSWGDPGKALVFLLCMLALVFLGGGRYSLDHAVFGRRRVRGGGGG